MNSEREQLIDLLLGQLSPTEEAQLRAELRRRPQLQADWQADQDTLLVLVEALAQQEVSVPAGSEARLLARLREARLGQQPGQRSPAQPSPAQRPARPAPSAGPAAMATPLRPGPRDLGAVALALLGLAAAVGLTLWLRPPDDALARYQAAAGRAPQTVEISGQVAARLVRLNDGRVFVRMSRVAPAQRTYQLWDVRGQTPVSLGTFDQEVLSSALAPTSAVAVSVEPPGGSAQPTTTPLFVQRL